MFRTRTETGSAARRGRIRLNSENPGHRPPTGIVIVFPAEQRVIDSGHVGNRRVKPVTLTALIICLIRSHRKDEMLPSGCQAARCVMAALFVEKPCPTHRVRQGYALCSHRHRINGTVTDAGTHMQPRLRAPETVAWQ